MDVEHLWFSSHPSDVTDRHVSGHGPNSAADDGMVQTLAEMADKRLYKLVKWCKSLPLFKNILVRQAPWSIQLEFVLRMNSRAVTNLIIPKPQSQV